MGRKGEREEQGGSRLHDSLIGQLFWYLLAAQLRRFQVVRHTEKTLTPILALYFENFNVRKKWNVRVTQYHYGHILPLLSFDVPQPICACVWCSSEEL